MNIPVIILGFGGHARVLIDVLRLQGIQILGISIPDEDLNHKYYDGIPIIGNDKDVLEYSKNDIRLINGLGSVKESEHRKKLYEQFSNMGYQFTNAIHPSAIISSNVHLSEAVQVMAGAVIQPGAVVGINTIINTRASIDHDCNIGSHVHIAPGVTISGGVIVNDNVHVGTGAVIIQGVSIGNNSVIGAGAVVINNVFDNTTVLGVPARVKGE